jgi:transposase
MNKQNYDDEFKLEVVKTYFEGKQGVRLVARSFGLPSKNYIHRWIAELTDKGLLDPKAIEARSRSNIKSIDKKIADHSKTAREKQLEKEVLRLKAENDFLKKLEELERRGFPNK